MASEDEGRGGEGKYADDSEKGFFVWFVFFDSFDFL